MTSRKRKDPRKVASAAANKSNAERALRAELKAAQATISQLQAELEQSRNAKVAFKKQRAPRRAKGDFIRFFLPDSHGANADPKALAALLADLERLQPKEVYLMGDHVDCGGFLAQHHTLGYVAETSYTYAEDVDCANQLLDNVQSICPKAKITYIEGNHERRVETWCVTQALRNEKDAEFLYRTFGPSAVLHTEKRGIRYCRVGEFHDGLSLNGTVRVGKGCFATHGTNHGVRAAAATLKKFNASVIFGHVHKLLMAVDRNVKDGEIVAYSVGHVSRQQPYWRHGNFTDWSQGYGFQVVQQSSDEWLHVNVPIIDGRSFLGCMLDVVR